MRPGRPPLADRIVRAAHELGGEPPAPGVTRYLGVYLPSFHPPALITVDVAPTGDATLRFATRDAAPVVVLADGEPDGPPPYFDECADVPAARAGALQRALEPCLAGAAALQREFGIDGMSVLAAVLRGDAPPLLFEGWSPVTGTPQHTYFAALHGLARELLTDPESRRRLDQLHGYLDLGLPVADLGGAPRHVRIFGRLTSSDEVPLREFLEAAGPEAPVLVEMLEFEGMGTLLYPLLRRFDRAPRRVAWVARGRVRQMLADAGVRGSHIFGDVDAARARLLEPEPG